MSNILEFEAAAGRLDQVAAAGAGHSRSQVTQWIAAGHVQVDGVPQTKPGFKLRGGERLRLEVPAEAPQTVDPEDVDLEVLYEDEHLIAINKPAGMVTHPAPGVTRGTLVNALLGRVRLAGEGEAWGPEGYRPGIVHRLDKDTSGVIVVAKTALAHARLAEAFKERDTAKTYLAITAGRVSEGGRPVTLEAPIGRHPVNRQMMAVNGSAAREALTRFVPLASFCDRFGRWYGLVRAEPRTGRTHQIRVHLAYLKAPILGDEVYGRASEVMPRQALHAWKLELPHPVSGETLRLEAPIPEDLMNAWITLGGELPSEHL
ncbi:23S rRNA pseudouridine1911/1915/1917 synthase [Deinobacterium chartae]|uniref:Pseudouridine synthase n=1 Tax=Deinobacterium chartae TaxID=521158 RepID=A0A841HWB2_9DEIO|nr:RluA family pseudouridine synthase [Deinobacterium chartae]MBB6097206.1 23S rRNA pseudouridine1911/1915/1917 synthase [Deinobacterium chartae]